MSRLSRQEMKRDEVREFLSSMLLYLSENLKLVGIAVGGVVALFLVGLLIAGYLSARQEQASDLLAEALARREAPLASELPEGAGGDDVYADETARRRAAREGLAAVLERYPRSDAARVARATLAKIAFQAGDLDEARQGWSSLVEDGSRDALRAEAELALVHLDRAAGEAARAEERLDAMLDSGTAALPKDVLLRELALIQQELGKTEESLATYRRLLAEHPDSPYANEARRRTSEAV